MPSPPLSAALRTKHSLRVRRTLYLASLTLGLACLWWAVYFALHAYWTVAAFDAVLVLVAAGVAWLNWRGKTRPSALLLAGCLGIGLSIMCVVLDIPSAQAPRAAHHYFLLMGVGSIMLFRGETPWLRHGIPLACFAAYFGFASTQWGWVTPFRLSDEVRIGGTWLTNAICCVLLYALLEVMQADLREHNVLESSLHKALPGNQFVLHYQPQVGADGRIQGGEALLRWEHPQLGRISPADFIPVAEQTGLILPIGHWVLGTACAQLVAWADHPDTAHLTLAVNVSAQQFRQPDYVAQVRSVLERSGARPERLKLELTESMLVNDVDDTIAKMTALQAWGVGLALDDFGTGYSSLSYLKKLPLNQLKIDQSFVRDLLTNPQDAAIARVVVGLAHSMGLDVIAEGVETEDQRAFLASIGCHAYQGYLVSKPLPVAQFAAFLAAYNRKLQGVAL
jgi:EAL domain-containing protein (putative c-di-GMP-specific phosphodiesterase class I)